MKKRAPIFLCSLIFLLGFATMFYPTISNWVHEQTASYVISDYLNTISTKTTDEAQEQFLKAREYNQTLTGTVKSIMIADENVANGIKDELYYSTFDEISGIIGVIDLPAINVTLPIYHGTEESILQKGVGHLEGSALPTGEINEHTVLTGHTGLPEAELFTDLYQLSTGDTFSLQVLDRVFTYEICDINVVLPSETQSLKANEDKNLVTLVTCTPYGVNSHRLLVTGELSDVSIIDYTVQTDNIPIVANNPLKNLPILIIISVILLVIFVIVVVITIITNKKRNKEDKL